MRGMVLPYDPQGRVDADGRISPADEADEHDQGEVLRRIAAKEVQGTAGEEYCRQGIDTAMDTLGDTVMGQFFIRVRPAVGPRVFTDAVEDDDGFVHGVADDGQDGRQEGRIDFQMKEREEAQDHDQVVQDRH